MTTKNVSRCGHSPLGTVTWWRTTGYVPAPPCPKQGAKCWGHSSERVAGSQSCTGHRTEHPPNGLRQPPLDSWVLYQVMICLQCNEGSRLRWKLVQVVMWYLACRAQMVGEVLCPHLSPFLPRRTSLPEPQQGPRNGVSAKLQSRGLLPGTGPVLGTFPRLLVGRSGQRLLWQQQHCLPLELVAWHPEGWAGVKLSATRSSAGGRCLPSPGMLNYDLWGEGLSSRVLQTPQRILMLHKYLLFQNLLGRGFQRKYLKEHDFKHIAVLGTVVGITGLSFFISWLGFLSYKLCHF